MPSSGGDPTCTTPTLTTVDTFGVVDMQSSMALNSGSYPIISYYDSSGGNLRLAFFPSFLFNDGFESGNALGWSVVKP